MNFSAHTGPMRTLTVLILLCVLCGSIASSAPPDFARDVQPILVKNCFRCHAAEKQMSSYRLDRRDVAMKGGEFGEAAIVAKKADESPLIRYVSGQDEAMLMPPESSGLPRLSAADVKVLREWVEAGAEWPDALSGGTDPRFDHWAWKKVLRPEVPSSEFANPIDAFVSQKLAEKGLAMSGEADRRTLIRRLSFDLIGLPPTPAEVDQFVADQDPKAYEKLVERLLASPRYGERWARHWLDVVRFAESHGFEMNQPRPNAWPYRDYVIDAFNTDKPYDQFIREQLAGDAMGADAATGFIVGGPWDQVKSPDPVLTAQQRADELNDMVGTTGSAFLGLTVSCARCHDHKFDPITAGEYYSMVACFAGVQHGERGVRPADWSERERRATEIRRELEKVQSELRRAQPLARVGAGASQRMAVSARENVDRFAPVSAKFVRFTVLGTSDAEPCIDELEIFAAEGEPRNVALSSAGAKVTSSGDFPANAFHKREHLNDGQYGNERSWISNERGRGWVEVELAAVETVDRLVWSRDRSPAPKYADRLATRYEIAVSSDRQAWTVVANDGDRIPYVGGSPQNIDPKLLAGTPELAALAERASKLDAELKAALAMPTVYAGQFVGPGETFKLHRGDPMQKKERVGPGGLKTFGGELPLAMDASDKERRIALGAWIANAENPLTARVMVNRLWHYHFGTGIVDTPSDFGLNGGRPSHPELLDWLASEFVARNWSVKAMHRLIVESRAYRQGSGLEPGNGLGPRAKGLEPEKAAADESSSLALRSRPSSLDPFQIDASNRLLWRYSPRRLEAEPLRDAILAVSGKLNLKAGGPGFNLFEANSNYVRVYVSRTEFGDEEFRRMVYQAKPRVELDTLFGGFDCPDAGQIAPRRNQSTTPLQALGMLNSEFMQQQSAAFADRLRAEAGLGPGDQGLGPEEQSASQIRLAFRLAYGREPVGAELDRGAELVSRHGLESLCRAIFNTNEFFTVR
jgi:hypothetical protein